MQATPNLEHTNWNPSFATMLGKMWRNLISTVVNGHIGFGDGVLRDNIDGSWISVVSPVTPDTDFTVTHNLGRIPVGYLTMSSDKANSLYTGSVVATSSQLTLRCNVASAALKLFIICLVLLVGVANAQNARKDDIAVFNANGFVKVIPSALITVCTSVATGTPCAPLASVCASASDAICTAPNPFNADLNGNFGFWIAPGTYVVTITGVGAQAKTITYVLGNSSGGGGGGGGTPGGSSGQLQYNNAGVFGGFGSYNSGTGATTVPGSLTAGAAGGVAGIFGCPQGTLPSTIANYWLFGCQTSVSASGVVWQGPNKLGSAAGGVHFGNASGNYVTLSQSGDSKHSYRATGVTSTVTNQTVCLAADCPAGEYELSLHLNSTVVCATPGPATVTPTITFTDDAGTKTNQAIPLVANGSTTVVNVMALGNSTNSSYNIPISFWSTGVNPITITLTIVACTSGTQTVSASAEVVGKI